MPYAGLPQVLDAVRAEIVRRQQAGGWTHPVTIIAVTKTHGPEAVQAARAAGLTAVGENRVQEARAKQDALGAEAGQVAWHLIGGLQTNKARHAVGRFALIHSVDNAVLARELDRRVAPGARQAVLVQVNCSDEPQKGGVAPGELPALLAVLDQCPRLDVRGLMTMAAFTDDGAVQRATFRQLRTLRDAAARPDRPLAELSMGMSGDYGAAVEEGSTMIRLGTILFGERERV